MNFKAKFDHKEMSIEADDADVIGMVELTKEQYRRFRDHLLDDYDFIADYSKNSYDDGDRKHCLLVLEEKNDDGILVCSEGSFYARYVAYLPKARRFLEDEVQRVADLMIKSRFGDAGKGAWAIGWDDIKEHFDLTVTKDNGVGKLLIQELEKREEVDQIIATEDCIEITQFLNNCPEGMTGGQRLLTVFSLMGCNLQDVHIIDRDEEHEVATITELNENTLTEEGKKEWADVLSAKVIRVYEGSYGTQIEVTGCPAHRLRDFSYALAGYCSEEDWSRWFNSTAPTQGPTIGEQS